MYILGLLHANDGPTQDFGKARAWYEKAAEKGNSLAMYQLGWLHQNGLGVPQDYAMAREWHIGSAERAMRVP